jgi:hypothetical protein
MSNFKEVDGGQGKGCRGAHPSDKQDLPGLAGSSKKWDSFRSNMAGWKPKNHPFLGHLWSFMVGKILRLIDEYR